MIKKIIRFFIGYKTMILIMKHIIKPMIKLVHLTSLLNKKIYLNKEFVKEINNFEINKKNVFIGYYDKNPLNNNLLLANYIEKEKAIVGYFDIKTKKFKILGETFSWSWQFGTRIQWFNLKKKLIIYNYSLKKESKSIITNLEGKTIKKLDFPIFDYNEKNKIATSINFYELYNYEKGYGYPNSDEKKEKGLFIIDIIKNKRIKIVCIEKLRKYFNLSYPKDYIMLPFFSPKGDKIAFLYKWKKERVTYAKLFTYNLKNKKLNLINKEGYISHFNWKNNSQLIFILNKKREYKYYYCNDSNRPKLKEISNKLPLKDGHLTYCNKQIITDTYPSLIKRRQKLYIYDLKKDKLNKLFEITSLINHEDIKKCDFHPKFDSKSKSIIIDSGDKKLRKIVLIKI